MKIYFITSSTEDTPSEDLLKQLDSLGSVIVIKHKGRLSEIKELAGDTEEKVLALDPGVFDWDLDTDAFKSIPNVKAVCTSSTSFGWLHPQELKELGITACNVPGFSADSVAEYALCMAIETARRMPSLIKSDGWEYDFENNHPVLLKAKTAGIVGLGRIGTRMAEVCKGIGMNIVYWSRKSRDDRFEYVELDDLFKISDVIMPALIENDETKKLITHERLDLVKTDAILVGINRVRAIWDGEYVLEKVKNREIGGYAFEGEDVKSPSHYEGNVWSLPAMIWYTKDSLENLLRIWVDNVALAAQGKPQNVVN